MGNASIIEFHEAANLFPMMSEDEFSALKKDIATNGLVEPIWMYDGKIIDGRNRYRACLETNVVPRFRQWNGDGSLVAFVISLNLQRRSLTSSQKATIAVQSLPMIEAEAKERQLSGLKQGAKMPVVQKVEQRTEPAKKSIEIAAEITGTNHEYVASAKNIQKSDPAMFKRIQNGEISIKRAKEEIKKKDRKENPSITCRNECTEALQFSAIAINQLRRIRQDDPRRIEALNKVLTYINKELVQ